MKIFFATITLVLFLSLGHVEAGSSLADPTPPSSVSRCVEGIKDALLLYQSEDGFVRRVQLGLIAQYQVAVVQPNGSNGLHLRDGASPFNQEVRRLWATFKSEFSTGTSLHAIWKFGGIPSMDSYVDGHSVDNYSYAGIFTAYMDQKVTDEFSVKLGKIKTLFLDEYIRPNMSIPTVERSLLYHQYLIESNWGLELRYAPSKASYAYVQLLANDRASGTRSQTHPDAYLSGEGLKGEWGMEDKLFLTAGGKYRFYEREAAYRDVSVQYTHDFNNVYDGRRESGANNYGIRVKDAFTLGYQMREQDFYFDAALLANIEQQKADYTRGSGKSVGLSLMPRYRIHDHVELVTRYAFLSGRGAVSLAGERYWMKQTTADTMVDSAHSFYVGVNYFFAPAYPDAAKFMLGAEYLTARKAGASESQGWTYTAALRFYF